MARWGRTSWGFRSGCNKVSFSHVKSCLCQIYPWKTTNKSMWGRPLKALYLAIYRDVNDLICKIKTKRYFGSRCCTRQLLAIACPENPMPLVSWFGCTCLCMYIYMCVYARHHYVRRNTSTQSIIFASNKSTKHYSKLNNIYNIQ